MAYSLQQEFALLDPEVQEAWLAEQDEETLAEIVRQEWWWISRPEQVPPETGYTVFLYLGGRGTGKTRSGSEWVAERAIRYPYTTAGKPTEHLVVAESLAEARKLCVEGDSGILNVLDRRGIEYHYTRSPKPKITLVESGAKIFFEGADNPDCGRGGNNTSIWLDEVCTWRYAERVWLEGLLPSLRADIPGDRPRCFVTTTPKPIELLKMWVAEKDGSVEISRGSTFDNAINLNEAALSGLKKLYEGTRIGRQELYGEMLEDIEGALFSGVDITATRVDIGPEVVKSRVIAVDPSLTGAEDGDEMGIIVAVRDERDHIYILADASVRLVHREAAIHCWRVFEHYACDVMVVEDNLGKGWLKGVLNDAYIELRDNEGLFESHTNPPLQLVHSGYKQGKKLRAEPVAMRYQQHRVHMVGVHKELEDQLVSWDPLSSRESPDRLDAFVYACRWLMEGEKTRARLIMPTEYQVPALQTGYHVSTYVPNGGYRSAPSAWRR